MIQGYRPAGKGFPPRLKATSGSRVPSVHAILFDQRVR